MLRNLLIRNRDPAVWSFSRDRSDPACFRALPPAWDPALQVGKKLCGDPAFWDLFKDIETQL